MCLSAQQAAMVAVPLLSLHILCPVQDSRQDTAWSKSLTKRDEDGMAGISGGDPVPLDLTGFGVKIPKAALEISTTANRN